MRFHKNDAVIGAFVLAALAIFVTVAIVVNKERFSRTTYTVEIRLPNIAGIDKGTEIIYNGYKAGVVEDITIEYQPEFRFGVRLAVKKQIQLKGGTAIMAKNKGLGGSKYLELVPPEPGLEKAGLVKEGDVLPVTSEMDLGARAKEVMGEVQKFVKDFQKSDMASGLQKTLAQAISAIDTLNQILVQTNAAMTENRAALKTSVANMESITTTTNKVLEAKNEALIQVLENVRQTTNHLPAVMKNIEELTADLKKRPWRLIRKGDEAPAKVDHVHEPAVQKSTAPSITQQPEIPAQ